MGFFLGGGKSCIGNLESGDGEDFGFFFFGEFKDAELYGLFVSDQNHRCPIFNLNMKSRVWFNNPFSNGSRKRWWKWWWWRRIVGEGRTEKTERGEIGAGVVGWHVACLLGLVWKGHCLYCDKHIGLKKEVLIFLVICDLSRWYCTLFVILNREQTKKDTRLPSWNAKLHLEAFHFGNDVDNGYFIEVPSPIHNAFGFLKMSARVSEIKKTRNDRV